MRLLALPSRARSTDWLALSLCFEGDYLTQKMLLLQAFSPTARSDGSNTVGRLSDYRNEVNRTFASAKVIDVSGSSSSSSNKGVPPSLQIKLIAARLRQLKERGSILPHLCRCTCVSTHPRTKDNNSTSSSTPRNDNKQKHISKCCW
jgi:hypothetical protein